MAGPTQRDSAENVPGLPPRVWPPLSPPARRRCRAHSVRPCALRNSGFLEFLRFLKFLTLELQEPQEPQEPRNPGTNLRNRQEPQEPQEPQNLTPNVIARN